MISLSHIAKSYDGRQVLADVNLRVARGEALGVVGPSGCGKTTILEIVSGVQEADAGTRAVDTARIGYAFQDDVLLPWLTVEENLLLVLSGGMGDEKARGAASAWLEKLGLDPVRGRKPLELSGGMRRRLNIARSLAVGPELLLLDEPFAFQDADGIAVLRRELDRMTREAGITVVIVSHDLANLEPLVRRTVRIDSAPVRLDA